MSWQLYAHFKLKVGVDFLEFHFNYTDFGYLVVTSNENHRINILFNIIEI